MLQLALAVMVSFLWGQNNNSVTQSAIQRSTESIVKKERIKALKVLSNAINHPGLTKQQLGQLREAYKMASEIFFTDRGQSLYQAAMNLYLFSPTESVKKLDEALKVESHNVLVIWALVKAHLKLGHCDRAAIEYEKLFARERAEKPEFEALNSYCLGQMVDVKDMAKLRPYLSSFYQGLNLYRQKKYEKASVELEKAKRLSPSFIEVDYWLWKINPAKKEFGLKYRKTCESQKVALAKEFEDFPQMCHFLPEVLDLESPNGF